MVFSHCDEPIFRSWRGWIGLETSAIPSAAGTGWGRMSEFRLRARGIASSQYLAQLDDPRPFKFCPSTVGQRGGPAEAVKTLVFGPDEIDVAIPLVDGALPELLLQAARSALGQIVELDEVAARGCDDTQDDGYLASLEVVSSSEVDLHYFAAHVNSEWNEVFRRDHEGRWGHFGVRRRAGSF